MKLSNLFLPLILIFTIQFASVHTQTITGTWSSFIPRSEASSLCCVPPSISITKNSYSSDMVATFNIGSSYKSKCVALFGSVTSASVTLSKAGIDRYSGSRYSQLSFKTATFSFDVTGSSMKVSISDGSYSSYDNCEFVSYIKTGGSSTYSSSDYSYNSNYNYNSNKNVSSSSDTMTELFFKGVIWVVIIIIAGICKCLKHMDDQGGAQKNVAVAVPQSQSHVNRDHFDFNSDAYRPPSNNNAFVAPHNNNTFSDNIAYAPSVHVHMSSSGTQFASGDAAAAYQANHYSNQHYGPQPVL